MIKTTQFVIGMVCTAVGGVLFTILPAIGTIIIIIGIAISLYSYLESESARKSANVLLEAQSQILTKSGSGNPYLEAAKNEARKRGATKKFTNYVEEAHRLDPNDIDALAYLCTNRVLELSFVEYLCKSDETSFKSQLTQVHELIKEGIEKAPQNPIFYESAGIIADLEGDHEQARRQFEKSALFRSDPYWRISMAVSWVYSGRIDKAMNEMDKAKKEGAHGVTFEFQYGNILQAPSVPI